MEGAKGAAAAARLQPVAEGHNQEVCCCGHEVQPAARVVRSGGVLRATHAQAQAALVPSPGQPYVFQAGPEGLAPVPVAQPPGAASAPAFSEASCLVRSRCSCRSSSSATLCSCM